jgi:hypothetical protein
VISFPHFV